MRILLIVIGVCLAVAIMSILLVFLAVAISTFIEMDE